MFSGDPMWTATSASCEVRLISLSAGNTRCPAVHGPRRTPHWLTVERTSSPWRPGGRSPGGPPWAAPPPAARPRPRSGLRLSPIDLGSLHAEQVSQPSSTTPVNQLPTSSSVPNSAIRITPRNSAPAKYVSPTCRNASACSGHNSTKGHRLDTRPPEHGSAPAPLHVRPSLAQPGKQCQGFTV
jgi:hypothetical protein